MIITIKIADGQELAVAKNNDIHYPENKPPSLEQLEIDLTTMFHEKLVYPAYEKSVKDNPIVLAKEAELKALIEAERAKLDSVKAQGK